MLFDDTLRSLLQKARTIAIVGAKDKAGQPVDMVGRYLIEVGYNVIPVHPVRRQVWGLQAYPSLADVPESIDIVNLFRAPQYCADHARETLALASKPLLFWMQEGIGSAEAGALLMPANIAVVEDACIMIDHRRLLGGLYNEQ